MNSNERNIILLAAARIVNFGKPGTVKHSANEHDDRLEFSAEVEGKVVILYFTQHNHTLYHKAEGGEVVAVNYNATCFVDGVRAFGNIDCGISLIRDIFAQVASVMKRDKADYFSKQSAFDFLLPTIEAGTNIDMPEPDDKLDDGWQHEFTGQFVKYDRGFAVIRDGDGDFWDIEPYRLIISQDQ